MNRSIHFLAMIWVVFTLALIGCPPADDGTGTPGGDDTPGGDTDTVATGGYEPYDIGSPTLTELWVDPVAGSDGNVGTSRGQALRTILAAWDRIPENCTTTGYRINITPGNVAYDEGHSNFYSNKHGTHDYPIIIRAADGADTATILGGLNIADVSYLYLINLRVRAGGEAHAWGNNNLHVEGSDHVLVRGSVIAGPVPDTGSEIREGYKANQSQYLYLEDSEVYGGYLTGIDWVSVQYGHILGCRIHDFEGDWGTYFKGGTSYIQVAGNEYYNCRMGFSAGQATNFEIIDAPWIQYEVYDIKFVDNVLHDIIGNGMGVQGGYNILFAYNTLYNVATDAGGYGMLLVARGSRLCQDTSENGEHNADTICNAMRASGGWCPVPTGPDGSDIAAEDVIPNRNVYVYNNIFYNPTGSQTAYATLDMHGPATPPAGSNIPSPALADENLRIRGNIFYDGAADHLGVTGDPGTACASSNPTCNPTQLAADNVLGTQPALVDPAHGNYRPVAAGNVFTATVFDVPDFTWSEVPASVPTGVLSNDVTETIEGTARTPDHAGAY